MGNLSKDFGRTDSELTRQEAVGIVMGLCDCNNLQECRDQCKDPTHQEWNDYNYYKNFFTKGPKKTYMHWCEALNERSYCFPQNDYATLIARTKNFNMIIAPSEDMCADIKKAGATGACPK